jgi:hypothetical protein
MQRDLTEIEELADQMRRNKSSAGSKPARPTVGKTKVNQ